MSYGWPMWIDDYTYRALFEDLERTSATTAAALPDSWLQAGEYLYAAGIITPTNQTVSFDYFYRRSEAKPSLLEQSWQQSLDAGAAYSLTLEDQSGQILYTHPFTPSGGYMGITSTLLFFGEVFPYDPATARIALWHDGAELASRAVSANVPTVTILSPSGGESFTDTLPISWQGVDADVGDQLLYTIQYSPDDGNSWLMLASDWLTPSLTVEDVTWLPGSNQARVRVTASDGVNTGQAISARFSLARRAPEAHILEPPTGSTFVVGQKVALRGMALDPEDGPLSGEAQLAWTSNISGMLGTGSELALSLPEGTHRIMLTATDSDQMTGSAEVVIHVVAPQRLYLPLSFKE
jgi:hypothetical protein